MFSRLLVILLVSAVILTACQSNQDKVSSNAEITIKKVAKIYGEENPQIVDIKTTIAESTKVTMYIVNLKGNFVKEDKRSQNLRFSVTEDGKKVWSLTFDTWQEDSVNISN